MLLNGLVSTPQFKDQRFSTRRDVINKTIFRSMKRFYIKLFKKLFPKLKVNSNSLNEFLDASKTLLESVIGCTEVNDNLKFFMLQLTASKLTQKLKVNPALAHSLKLLDSCLYSYSDKALRSICKDASAKLLFTHFYLNGQEFFRQEKNVTKNLAEYSAAFESIYQCFNA
jgi:hypothetical protein